MLPIHSHNYIYGMEVLCWGDIIMVFLLLYFEDAVMWVS